MLAHSSESATFVLYLNANSSEPQSCLNMCWLILTSLLVYLTGYLVNATKTVLKRNSCVFSKKKKITFDSRFYRLYFLNRLLAKPVALRSLNIVLMLGITERGCGMRTAGRMLATLFIRVPAVDCVGTEAGNGVQRCGEDRGEPRLKRHAKNSKYQQPWKRP